MKPRNILRRILPFPSIIFTGSLAVVGITSTQAASQTWDGGSLVNGNWSTITNWLSDLVPGSTSLTTSPDVATFNAAIANTWGNSGTPIVIDPNRNIAGLTFTGAAGSYTIGITGGNALRLSSGGSIQIASTLTATNVIQTINAPLALQGTTYSFINDSALGRGTLVIGGGFTGTTGATTLTLGGTNTSANTVSGIIGNGTATSVAVTKSGAGTWVLSGANTYTGLTTVSAGVLNIQNASALGTVTAGTSVTSGAALQIQGGITTLAEALTLNGTGLSTTGALHNLSGDNTYAGLLTLGSATRINSDAGTLTLNNTGTITGATFGLEVGGAGNTTIHSVIGTTSGTLTKDGTGSLTLNRANTYTGRTNVNGGTLLLHFGTVSSNILSSSSPLTVGGGTLQLSGTGTQTMAGLTTTASTGSRILMGASQTLTLGVLTSAGASSALNINTAAGNANGATIGSGLVVLTGQTAGNAINPGFTVTDAGGFGLATVNASNQVVRLTTTTLLPASGAVVGTNYRIDNNAGSTTTAGSSTLAISASQAANSLTVDTSARNGTIALSSGVILSSNTWNFGGTNSNTWEISGSTGGAGLRAVATGNTIEISNYAAGTVTLSSPILANGTNAVNFKGTGTTVLTKSNTYSGSTTVRGGTLEVGVFASITHTTANLIVGSASGENGTFNLKGGTVANAATFLGSNAGSLGTANVRSGSWNNVGQFIAGNAGTGVLNFTGGTISNTSATLGSGAGSLGEATVSGGIWTNSSDFTVGDVGRGVLNLSGRGEISNTGGILGNSAGGLGTANVSGGTWTNSSALTVGSSGTGVFNLSGTATISSMNAFLGRNVGSHGAATISGGSWTNTLDFAVGNSGTGEINLSGTGVIINNRQFILGSNLGGLGTVNVSGGTWTNSVLTVGTRGTGVLNLTGGTVHAGGAAGTGTVTLATNSGSSGTLNFGTGGTVGTLNAATVTGGSGTAVVNFNHTGSLSVAPVLSGNLSVNKLGAGTTTLSKANTYTGPTTVNGGTLVVGVGGAGSITSSVIVNSGATLSGSGTITGAVSLKNGATHNAGNSPGTQTIVGNTTYEAGSIFAWDISSNSVGTRGTTYDGVNVTGNLTVESGALFRVIQNADVNFSNPFWRSDQSWSNIFHVSGVLSAWDSNTPVAIFDTTNTLQNVSSFGSFTITGSTLNWSAVPEPSSALVGILLATGLMRRRRSA